MEIIVCGAGPIGLATALMLRRDGHDVVVLERDPASPPDSPGRAWDGWERRSVPQFMQAHTQHARFRHELERSLPDLVGALKAAGAYRHSQLGTLPPFITDRDPRPDDDRFDALTARRPVLEHVIASAAEDEIAIRRGVKLTGPLTGTQVVDGAPHITGVVTDTGEELRADLIIDAMGRRSPLDDWITGLGGRAPAVEGGDIGFTYYTRFFSGERVPEQIGPPLAEYPTFSILALPADNSTWSITLYSLTGDRAMKRLREPEVFDRVHRACPLHAHWADGVPLGGIQAMSGVLDKLRTFVLDDAPVVTGILPVGDAWACTNPSLGRGLSLGMMHARVVRDAVRTHGEDYAALVRTWHERTEDEVTPWVRAQMQMDDARVAAVQAARDEAPPPPGNPMVDAFITASLHDADVFRARIEIVSCQATPEEIFARPGFIETVQRAAEGKDPFVLPGPGRDEVLELVS